MRTMRWRLIVIVLMASVWVAAAAAQTVGLNRVMRAKLEHAQQILGDVVTSNWSHESDSRAVRWSTESGLA